jgi:hypothetical protein
MSMISRRDFVRRTALATAIIQIPLALLGVEKKGDSVASEVFASNQVEAYTLHWLDGTTPTVQSGITWGLPWPRGLYPKDSEFTLICKSGKQVPIQTWPTAYWPDGSLKWTGHAIPANVGKEEFLQIKKGKPVVNPQVISISEDSKSITVDTGVMSCEIEKSGLILVKSMKHGEKTIAQNGRLVGSRQDAPERNAPMESFTGKIDSCQVEQSGLLRSVVKVTGSHELESGKKWLPFTLRLTFYAGGESMQMTHTFVFDGDEEKDFISSLGFRFDVNLVDERYNRHIRFAGENGGIWGEGVKGITGLRRDPGQDVRTAQVKGVATPPIDTWDKRVSSRMHWVPSWNDYSLSQPNANGFSIRKRTKEGHAWIDADQGHRAAGGGYIGGVSGGLAFAMRDFWKLHPTQIDVRGAAGDQATVTMWMWSPDANPMDIRFYHDGLGQETHEQELDAMNITYEDYEPGFGTPYGVARTTDLTFWVLDHTPSREDLSAMVINSDKPALLVTRPEDYLAAGVFGSLWSLPDRSTPAKKKIEDRLDWSVKFYIDQVDQRHWYGFWNYGDIMHTYDLDRHVWRYDVGGFAWDNSELSPDLWLWYSFLRTGDASTFRLAEAMTRHNRDVDIYHMGRFAGFGSRHNVQHWGCSAKQLRISSAAYRRFHYYLTADERTGDVLNEVIEADRQLATLNPVRKLPGQPEVPAAVRMGQGTDLGAVFMNWLTAWERTGDPKYKSWLENAMRVVGSHELGFFIPDYGYNVETKELIISSTPEPRISHLSSVFGLVEANKELMDLFDIPEFNRAWIDYCTVYSGGKQVHEARFGRELRGVSLIVAHSRLTAYASKIKNDPELAKRAVSEFSKEWGGPRKIGTQHIDGADVLNPIDEAAWVSTNDAAQWGLAAIQNVALIPDAF